MGEVFNLHTNVQGQFGMVEQYHMVWLNMQIVIQLCEMCIYNHLAASRTNRLAGS